MENSLEQSQLPQQRRRRRRRREVVSEFISHLENPELRIRMDVPDLYVTYSFDINDITSIQEHILTLYLAFKLIDTCKDYLLDKTIEYILKRSIKNILKPSNIDIKDENFYNLAEEEIQRQIDECENQIDILNTPDRSLILFNLQNSISKDYTLDFKNKVSILTHIDNLKIIFKYIHLKITPFNNEDKKLINDILKKYTINDTDPFKTNKILTGINVDNITKYISTLLHIIQIQLFSCYLEFIKIYFKIIDEKCNNIIKKTDGFLTTYKDKNYLIRKCKYDEDDKEECTICFETKGDYIILSCGHMMCEDCFLKYIKLTTSYKKVKVQNEDSVIIDEDTLICPNCRELSLMIDLTKNYGGSKGNKKVIKSKSTKVPKSAKIPKPTKPKKVTIPKPKKVTTLKPKKVTIPKPKKVTTLKPKKITTSKPKKVTTSKSAKL